MACSIVGANGPAVDSSLNGQLIQLRALDWGSDAPVSQHPLLAVYHPTNLGHEYEISFDSTVVKFCLYLSPLCVCVSTSALIALFLSCTAVDCESCRFFQLGWPGLVGAVTGGSKFLFQSEKVHLLFCFSVFFVVCRLFFPHLRSLSDHAAPLTRSLNVIAVWHMMARV
jgi:hypothetical protein